MVVSDTDRSLPWWTAKTSSIGEKQGARIGEVGGVCLREESQGAPGRAGAGKLARGLQDPPALGSCESGQSLESKEPEGFLSGCEHSVHLGRPFSPCGFPASGVSGGLS